MRHLAIHRKSLRATRCACKASRTLNDLIALWICLLSVQSADSFAEPSITSSERYQFRLLEQARRKNQWVRRRGDEVNLLIYALHHNNPVARKNAAVDLRHMNPVPKAALPHLIGLFSDPVEDIGLEAFAAANQASISKDDDVSAALRAQLRDGSERGRARALTIIGNHGEVHSALAPEVVAAFKNGSRAISEHAEQVLHKCGPGGIGELLNSLPTLSEEHLYRALKVLTESDLEDVEARIRQYVAHSRIDVQLVAVRYLVGRNAIPSENAIQVLSRALNTGTFAEKREAAAIAGSVGAEAVVLVSSLEELLRADPNEPTREARKTLLALGSKDIVAAEERRREALRKRDLAQRTALAKKQAEENAAKEREQAEARRRAREAADREFADRVKAVNERLDRERAEMERKRIEKQAKEMQDRQVLAELTASNPRGANKFYAFLVDQVPGCKDARKDCREAFQELDKCQLFQKSVLDCYSQGMNAEAALNSLRSCSEKSSVGLERLVRVMGELTLKTVVALTEEMKNTTDPQVAEQAADRLIVIITTLLEGAEP